MQIRYLSEDDITNNYLETLNDKEYMRFSQNSKYLHTLETQKSYIKRFQNTVEKPERLIFGIYSQEQLCGTLTTHISYQERKCNIGVLIFKNQAKEGLGTKALNTISLWLSSKFPEFEIEVGTSVENQGMIKLASNAGFQKKISRNANIYFKYQNSKLSCWSDDFDWKANRTLFVGSDTGGVEHLIESYLRHKFEKRLVIKGLGALVSNRYQINYFQELGSSKERADNIIFSTGSNFDLVGSLLNKSRKEIRPTYCVLDHWVNYRSRIHPSLANKSLMILTSNITAFEIASEVFPENRIELIPDYRIERYLNLLSVKNHKCVQSLLVILEPTRETLEGLAPISRNSYAEILNVAKSLARENKIERIVIRKHPVMDWKELDVICDEKDIAIEKSINLRLEDDLCCSSAVVGMSSSALYTACELGQRAFTILDHSTTSWLGRYKKIEKLSLKILKESSHKLKNQK